MSIPFKYSTDGGATWESANAQGATVGLSNGVLIEFGSASLAAPVATAGTTLPTESKAGEGGASALHAEPASVALRTLCDKLDAEKRRLRHTPGTGQNHSYLLAEDVDAYVEEAREALANAAAEDDSEFKNFHRLLCERFGYSHDERDWKRDQLSLIEFIATPAATAVPGDLPPLPEPHVMPAGFYPDKPKVYTAEHMREYGRACIASNAGAAQQPLMRQAVASVASNVDGEVRVNWMRPERVEAGSLLYCIDRTAQNDSPVGAQDDRSKPCKNEMLRHGVNAIPKSCPRCGINKYCPRDGSEVGAHERKAP